MRYFFFLPLNACVFMDTEANMQGYLEDRKKSPEALKSSVKNIHSIMNEALHPLVYFSKSLEFHSCIPHNILM